MRSIEPTSIHDGCLVAGAALEEAISVFHAVPDSCSATVLRMRTCSHRYVMKCACGLLPCAPAHWRVHQPGRTPSRNLSVRMHCPFQKEYAARLLAIRGRRRKAFTMLALLVFSSQKMRWKRNETKSSPKPVAAAGVV